MSTYTHHGAADALDRRDSAIVAERVTLRRRLREPSEGDWIVFADGVVRRASHCWFGEHVQTSDAGSWYLCASGHGSFSGSLYGAVPAETLTSTGELVPAPFWIFRHDWHTAHNGVDVLIDVRVWRCSVGAPS